MNKYQKGLLDRLEIWYDPYAYILMSSPLMESEQFDKTKERNKKYLPFIKNKGKLPPLRAQKRKELWFNDNE